MTNQTLKKRTLGKSGIEVTEIGLGLWAAGGSDANTRWVFQVDFSRIYSELVHE